MTHGTIKDRCISVEICDVGLEEDAPELGLGASASFNSSPLLGFLVEKAVPKAPRLWIIVLVVAILVVAVDAATVDDAALAASFIGSMSVVWPLRDPSSLRMGYSCWMDLSSSAAAYSIAVV